MSECWLPFEVAVIGYRFPGHMYEAVVVDNVVPAVVVSTCGFLAGVINGAAKLRCCRRTSSTPLDTDACCCSGCLCDLECGT